MLRGSARKKSKKAGPWSSPGRGAEALRGPARSSLALGPSSSPGSAPPAPAALFSLPPPFPFPSFRAREPREHCTPRQRTVPRRPPPVPRATPPPGPPPPGGRRSGASVQPRPPRQNKGMWGGGEKEERRPPCSPGPSAAQGRSLPLTEVRARHPHPSPPPLPPHPQTRRGRSWEERAGRKGAPLRSRSEGGATRPLQAQGSQPELLSRSGV